MADRWSKAISFACFCGRTCSISSSPSCNPTCHSAPSRHPPASFWCTAWHFRAIRLEWRTCTMKVCDQSRAVRRSSSKIICSGSLPVTRCATGRRSIPTFIDVHPSIRQLPEQRGRFRPGPCSVYLKLHGSFPSVPRPVFEDGLFFDTWIGDRYLLCLL